MEALQNCEVCGGFLTPRDAFVSSTSIRHRVQDTAGKCKPSPVLEEVLQEAVQAPEESFGDLIAEGATPEPEPVKAKKGSKKKEPKAAELAAALQTADALIPPPVEKIKRSHKKKEVAA